MPDPLLDILQRYWGYSQFRPGQRDAMDAVVQGRDSLLVLPTGGGKSLCFQAPALLKPGLALVISPLISLMKDQVDTLTAHGVPAAYLNSAMVPEARRQVMQGLRERRYRLLYVAPERIAGEGSTFVPWLHETCGLSFMAVDEAHCISHWGHDFRPEYRQIGALRGSLPGVSLHAFTATATARVRDDIVAQLGLMDPITLVGSFDRAKLLYRVLPRQSMPAQIRQVLTRHRGEAGIIYCPTRREVDALSASLAEEGYRVRPYHAGLTDEERHAHQEAFLNESVDIVVATVAFGMGIDRSDVRFVIHAGAPQSLEHYQQEAGRAGRDGLEAECVLIVSSGDFLRWRDILSKNGELTEVYETSTAIVRCQPQGDASLNGGHLVLKGTGYLTCDLNLAQTVFDNHKMTVKPVDTYGSICLRARALSTVNAPAPLFTHPDARYRLDFSATSSVGMEQSLLNGLGPQQTSFGGVTINTWNTYTFQYACIIAGPCPTTFRVGTQFQSNNLPGQWVNFATGPTTFEIGRDGGSYFVGRLDGLIIDPGNSAH